MCKGGKIAEKAVKTIQMAAKEGRVKDALRLEVASLILEAISVYFHSRLTFQPI
jgi:hypothetical protein